MKKILLFLMMSQLCFSQVFETVPLIENGPRDKRINMVVLGDGFTAAQQDTFVADATTLVNYIFNKAPYSQYRNYFNVYSSSYSALNKISKAYNTNPSYYDDAVNRDLLIEQGTRGFTNDVLSGSGVFLKPLELPK